MLYVRSLYDILNNIRMKQTKKQNELVDEPTEQEALQDSWESVRKDAESEEAQILKTMTYY